MNPTKNSQIAQPAPPGLRGFDTDTRLSAEQARLIFNAGYHFCVRYLSLPDVERTSDLTAGEVNDILQTGLGLMAVQHVSRSGWMPSGTLGKAYGQHAAAHARAVGMLSTVNIWLDLEGIDHRAEVYDVLDYCRNWYREVKNVGFTPGLYVGASSLLSGQELYEALPFEHYWKSLSRVPPVVKRGYQLVQQPGRRIFGVSIDEDFTQEDELNGSAIWMIRT